MKVRTFRGPIIMVPADMRTDARWFRSLGKTPSEHWRVSHGVSFDVGKR